MEENPYSAPESNILDEDNSDNSEIVLADRSTRLGASIIDSFILMLIFLPLAWALNLVNFETGNTSLSAQVISGLIGIAIYLVINGKLLLSEGQTIGKKLLKIKIINEETNKVPSFSDIIGKRYLFFMVLGQIPLANIIQIIDVLFIFRSSKKCLHDNFANTIVIKA